jgi:hypothetical protein
MKNTTLLIATCVATSLLWSCKKADPTPTPPAATTPTIATPTDAFGAFVAVKTLTEQNVPFVGVQVIEVGTAVGGFYSAANSGTWVDGGSLKVDDSTLTKQTNNTYFYQMGQSNPTGLSFGSTTRWAIGGNATNSIPTFNYTHSRSMPSLGTLTSAKDITVASDYTITTSTTNNSDSVIFIISGPNASIQKVKAGNTRSCLFTAAELGTLGKGDNAGLVQIAPYNIASTTQSGKKYYFIKETVLSTFVNLK